MQFNDKMRSLFQYGATKLNLPDKLLESMKFKTTVSINNHKFEPTLLMRKMNFVTHLYFKLPLDKIICHMKPGVVSHSLKISISKYKNVIWFIYY